MKRKIEMAMVWHSVCMDHFISKPSLKPCHLVCCLLLKLGRLEYVVASLGVVDMGMYRSNECVEQDKSIELFEAAEIEE